MYIYIIYYLWILTFISGNVITISVNDETQNEIIKYHIQNPICFLYSVSSYFRKIIKILHTKIILVIFFVKEKGYF